MHRIDNVSVPRAKKASKPSKIVITTANTDLAKSLEHELSALNVAVQLVDKPQAENADLIVLTEGSINGEPAISRHWAVLRICKTLRETEIPIVLLGRQNQHDLESITGLSGLSRTLRQEWPGVPITNLDISPSSSVKQIAQTLLKTPSDSHLDAGKLSTTQILETPLALPNTKSLSQSGNWLITGGARGVTAACAIGLARQLGTGKFFLAGRSDIVEWPESIPDCEDLLSLRADLIQRAKRNGERPRLPEIDRQARGLLASREAQQTLGALTAAGIEAHYMKLDISKRRSVQSTIAQLTSAHGPITGLVHGAGVLADRQAIKKTKADLTKVFAPKVLGLLNILDSIDVSALDHLGLFSSAAAVFGNPGQSDYAMANAWLNNVADQLHATHKGLRVRSFCWGPWAGGMVDETLAAQFAERGINLIELQDGAEIFAKHLLFGEDDCVNLLIGDRW